MSGVNDNYKEFGKRKFLDITDKKSGSDFEPKSESLRASTLKEAKKALELQGEFIHKLLRRVSDLEYKCNNFVLQEDFLVRVDHADQRLAVFKDKLTKSNIENDHKFVVIKETVDNLAKTGDKKAQGL